MDMPSASEQHRPFLLANCSNQLWRGEFAYFPSGSRAYANCAATKRLATEYILIEMDIDLPFQNSFVG